MKYLDTDPRSLICALCGESAEYPTDVIMFDEHGARIERRTRIPLSEHNFTRALSACTPCRGAVALKTMDEVYELATLHAVTKALES